MTLSNRENYIQNAKLMGAEWIPVFIYISDASWNEHRKEMEQVALKFPEYFSYVYPGWRDYNHYEYPLGYNSKKPYKDEWGCLWKTSVDGIIGAVTEHPLNDYSKLSEYKFPDYKQLTNFHSIKNEIKYKKSKGELIEAGLEHGHYFLRLQDLRGFENLMFDLVEDNANYQELAKKVEEIQTERIKRLAEFELDVFWFAEDLGSQSSSFISPEYFRKYIVPAYTRMIKTVKDKGSLIGMHSDGAIMNIIEDLIGCGLDIINIQDAINGIDTIANQLKGRLCIRLDIDRQNLLPYGTPKDIDDWIREVIEKLGSIKGGLEIIAGIYPPTPVKNVEALCNALRKYKTLPFFK